MKAVVVEINDKPVRLLLIRNPWGQSEWTGAYSDGSREMNVALLTKLEHETGDDGMFYMSCKSLSSCYLHLSSASMLTTSEYS